MLFDSVPYFGADVRFEVVQVLDGFQAQYDVVSHSGYILARTDGGTTTREKK